MMTQFFQVLKPALAVGFSENGFMMTQFFQVLKPSYFFVLFLVSFMMTQFFQVLKQKVKCKMGSAWFYDDSILSGTKT